VPQAKGADCTELDFLMSRSSTGIRLLTLLTMITLNSCSQGISDPIVASLSPADDPFLLPFRFVLDHERSNPGPTYLGLIDLGLVLILLTPGYRV
jgi:hypothetical protein